MANYVLDRAFQVEEKGGVERYRVVAFGSHHMACKYPDGPNAGKVRGVSTHSQSKKGNALTVRVMGVALCELAGIVRLGDPVRVADAEGRICCATGAFGYSDGDSVENRIIWLSRELGLVGNLIKIKIMRSVVQKILIEVHESDLTIVVKVANDSTANQVVDAIKKHDIASLFVEAVLPPHSQGTGVVPPGQIVQLSGGHRSTNVIGIAQDNGKEGDVIDVLLIPNSSHI